MDSYDIAEQMLREGADLDFVYRITGMNMNDIERLQAQLAHEKQVSAKQAAPKE